MSGVAPIQGRKAPAPIDPGLKKVAEQFEAIFLRQMITSMRQAKLAEDAFGSSATETFVEMGDARTADSLAALGRFGIARMIERQFEQRGGAE